jgi:DNA-binding CsgD family transcriptional regulator
MAFTFVDMRLDILAYRIDFGMFEHKIQDLSRSLEAINHKSLFIGVGYQGATPQVSKWRASEIWKNYYIDNRLKQKDPRLFYAFAARGMVDIEDLKPFDIFNFFDVMSEFGLNHGFIISFGDENFFSICSMSRNVAPFSNAEKTRALTYLSRHHKQIVKLQKKLTDRQRSILALFASGLGYCEIAQKLDISIDGVKAHISAIRRKLKAKNTMEAVSIAIRQGII